MKTRIKDIKRDESETYNMLRFVKNIRRIAELPFVNQKK